ncbi:MAG TPA: ATP-binding protein [Xanthobacteraceae bacterium]
MNAIDIIQVPSQVTQKWQEIVDLLAEVLHVPSALIMKVEPPNIRVFARSESEGNPYERDELACLNTGLYCETVMKTRQLLLVPDALGDRDWNTNPDIKLGMISYMGVPVAWPNGSIFGTICVLDGKPNQYSTLYRKLLFQCRDVLQADLTSLQARSELELKVQERTAELRRSEVYLTEAQRLSRTGSFGWNVSSGEIFWSEECSRIYGYDKALSVTVDQVLQRTHPEDLALVRGTIDRASSDGKDFDYEHRLLMPDGAVKHVHVAAHAVRGQADQLEFIGALIDITATKRAEEELHKAQTELAHATRVTTLGELTASIAHEVNQPLCAIAASAAASLRFLDREDPDLGEARGALRQIMMDSDRANEVIRRVRALANKADIQKVPLDINGVIEDVMIVFRHEALSHGVALRQELASALPKVVGDRVQLQQVIMNLLMNGMQATSSVTGRRHELRIRSLQHGPDQILVAVEDSGSGIETQDADRLFSAFFTTKPNGMGLGLSICRSIVEQHGGRIWATRNSRAGSTFQFTLRACGETPS